MKEDNLQKCPPAGNLDIMGIFEKISFVGRQVECFEHEINNVSSSKQQKTTMKVLSAERGENNCRDLPCSSHFWHQLPPHQQWGQSWCLEFCSRSGTHTNRWVYLYTVTSLLWEISSFSPQTEKTIKSKHHPSPSLPNSQSDAVSLKGKRGTYRGYVWKKHIRGELSLLFMLGSNIILYLTERQSLVSLWIGLQTILSKNWIRHWRKCSLSLSLSL